VLDEEATRAALAAYQEEGSDLARPMVLDFFLVLPDEAVAHVAELRTAPMGFVSRVLQDDEGQWLCVCSVELVPELARVIAVEKLLDRLAHELGGHADGFGSFGNAGE
jgi:hypothetical protein